MQITRQADYAVRAVLYLSKLTNGGQATTSQIARDREIPPSFLAKIVSQLSIAGVVNTSRGARGGVSLTRPPNNITLLEVVEAIDGPICLNECVNDPSVCNFSGTCIVHEFWTSAQADLVDRLATTDFHMLCSNGRTQEADIAL
ncbi:MAG TPA: Rrf2 family transcriptional regulator [Anaerolineae bacterium]|nr:Rrf2 family transcriptional regulator [Anaerolineae bacterium]